ncbi:hypothetical protein BDN71DRAFT_1435257 [Pleurotus eryngii]|uniref:Uncharacterized protein n=1 Tax=Pleurotus eryngii TaxID=5323 RepID=A0A9P5ZNN4_PLEER|nr:hypothetical protein BDN71DRAFT_1435257 [Pleurotus eryngii]
MDNENTGRHDPPRDQSTTGLDDNGPQGTNMASQSTTDVPMSPGESPQSPGSTHCKMMPTPVQATSELDEQSRLSQEAYNLTHVQLPPLPHLPVIHTKWNMYKPSTFGCSPSCMTCKKFQIHQFGEFNGHDGDFLHLAHFIDPNTYALLESLYMRLDHVTQHNQDLTWDLRDVRDQIEELEHQVNNTSDYNGTRTPHHAQLKASVWWTKGSLRPYHECGGSADKVNTVIGTHHWVQHTPPRQL